MKSGQTDFKTVAILRWDPATAQKRMEDILTKTYSGGAKVNGVLSPYDGLSIGILSALKSSGYGTAGQPYPIVTGQDAEVASVKSIIAGEQYATIYKDTRELAEVTVKMADAVLKGGKPVDDESKHVDCWLAALEHRVGHLDGDVGELAGVLVDRGVLLTGDDRLHRGDLGVLAGDDRVRLAGGAVAVALQRGQDADRQAVVGREHALDLGAAAVGLGEQVLHALLRGGRVPPQDRDGLEVGLAALDDQRALVDVAA